MKSHITVGLVLSLFNERVLDVLDVERLHFGISRKTPLRKPNHGEGIVSTKPRPKNVYDFVSLVYYFIVL